MYLYRRNKKKYNINNTSKIYLIFPGILQDVQSVPRFLTKFHVPPLVASIAKLSSNLDESPLVSEYCGDSISNCTAVPVPAGEAKQLSKLSVLEVGSVK